MSVRDVIRQRPDSERPRTTTSGGGGVVLGFEPTNGLPRYTLSSSVNHGSATAVGVRPVLNKPVRVRPWTPPDDDE